MISKTLIFLLFIGMVTSVPFNFEKKKHSVSILEKYNNTYYCAICEYLIHEGEEFVTKNTTEEDAVHYLEHLCLRLPKSKHNNCDDFIRKNYKLLIHLIVDRESANSICKQLHFCENYEHSVSECDFCKFASHRIERFMSNNNTLNEIIDYGNMFCNSYPIKYKIVCENTIPYYYSQIIGKLIDQYDLFEVCNGLSICN